MRPRDATPPGVILAGGDGRRIGGRKPERLLAGRPLWRHVADRIAQQVGPLAVNGVGRFGALPVIADETPGQGPLGGILAAMVWAAGQGADRVLTVAVDTPFLPTDLVARLTTPNARIAIAASSNGLHGTTALWDVSLAPDLRAALAQGSRKVTDWTAIYAPTPVTFEDITPPPFFNINTPEDLAQAEAWT